MVVDGHHLHPAVVGLALATGRAALVSDAIAAAGLPDGPAEIGGRPVTVTDGAARLDDGGALAGSVATLADCLRRVLDDGADLLTAVTAATLTPARVLGLDDRVGSIAAGARVPAPAAGGRV